jgi:uncharacterized protein YndB with AHSA1/START domain
MSPIIVTRTIPAPPEQVFGLFTDLDAAPERLSQIDAIERLTDGPVGVGTRWKETRTMFGRQATEEMEITEFAPPRAYAVEAESCGTRFRTDFRFSPETQGTRVEMQFVATPVSLFAHIMSPLSGLMKGMLVKCLEQDLDDLAQVAAQAGATPDEC